VCGQSRCGRVAPSSTPIFFAILCAVTAATPFGVVISLRMISQGSSVLHPPQGPWRTGRNLGLEAAIPLGLTEIAGFFGDPRRVRLKLSDHRFAQHGARNLFRRSFHLRTGLEFLACVWSFSILRNKFRAPGLRLNRTSLRSPTCFSASANHSS